jgi:predicted TIM-barrel fold metal-dependent hydrolase
LIVDAHTHLLPERLARKIRGFFEEHLTGAFAYEIDHTAVLDRHHADGITALWNLPYAHKADIASALNDAMLEISNALAAHPVDVIAGCTVHPGDADPAAELQRAVAGGARVLKLHCSVGRFELDDPRLADALEVASQLGVPVVYHAGHAISGSTDTADLAPLERAATAHPTTTFILAHFGHHALAAGIGVVETHANVYADLTPVVHDAVPVAAADLERLSAKLLFGTDAPNTGIAAGVLLAGLRAQASDATLAQILFANAVRLVQPASARK